MQKGIGTGAAGEIVPREDIIASSAPDQVVAVVSPDAIVARIAEQLLVSGFATDAIAAVTMVY